MNGDGTKTRGLVNSVLRAILDGKYGTGDSIPSEREMANRMGVSRVTVRRAYAELASASVLDRRQREGTRIVRTARGCTDAIRHVGLLTTWGPFGLTFLRALEKEVSAIGALLVIKTTEGRMNQEEEAAVGLVANGVRNLIIWPSGQGYRQTTYERLRVVGANMVFFDRIRPGAVADFVGLDNRDAVCRLLASGLEAGCERFDFVGYGGNLADSERERLDAFRDLCLAWDIPHACHTVPRDGDPTESLRAARWDGLGTGRRPGVLCVHDVLALRVRSVLDGAARLYGIDARPEAVAAGITSVEQPLEEMGRAALRLLWEQQAKGAAWRAQEIRFQGRLVTSGRKDGAPKAIAPKAPEYAECRADGGTS